MKKKIILLLLLMITVTSVVPVYAKESMAVELTEPYTGNSYQVGSGNKVTTIGSIYEKIVTPNKNYVVFQDKNGKYYYKKLNGAKKIALTADYKIDFDMVGNDGVIYDNGRYESGLTVYKHLFASNKAITVSDKVESYAKMDKATAIAFASSGKLYTMAGKSSTKKQVGTYNSNKKIELIAYAYGGKMITYAEYDDDTCNLYLLRDGKKISVGSFKNNNTPFRFHTFFDHKQNRALITGGNYMFASNKKTGKYVKSELPRIDEYTPVFYTAKSRYESDSNPNLDDFYISYAADLYYVGNSGSLKKMMASIGTLEISENYIAYRRNKKTYRAKLSKSTLKEQKQIGTAISTLFPMTKDGELFELTQAGGLYVYGHGKKLIKVAGGVYWFMGQIKVSQDKKTIYYIIREQNTGNLHDYPTTEPISFGTLYSYTMGGKSKKIATKVMYDFTLYSEKGKNDRISFSEYGEDRNNNEILIHFKYYDGSRVKTIKSNLVMD